MPLVGFEKLHVEIDDEKISNSVDLAVTAGEVHAIRRREPFCRGAYSDAGAPESAGVFT